MPDEPASIVAFPAPPPPSTPEEEIAALRAEVTRLARRLAEVELIADRDPLTPALNRRAFMRELSRTLAFLSRYGGEAAVIYFDLDGLKRINDAHGHAAGDAAIQAVTHALVDGVRESDVVGRLGGDEFAVLLARAPLADARAKAASLAAAVAAEPLAHEGRSLPLSVSYGVRALEPNADAARILAEADAAMYLAKAGQTRLAAVRGTSGDDVGGDRVLQPGDLVAQQELLLLQPGDADLVDERLGEQRLHRGVEVLVLHAQAGEAAAHRVLVQLRRGAGGRLVVVHAAGGEGVTAAILTPAGANRKRRRQPGAHGHVT